jgi:hypothetical protein
MNQRPTQQTLLITDTERQFFERLLPVLRAPVPTNGRPKLIVINQTPYYIGLNEASPKGKVDLKR